MLSTFLKSSSAAARQAEPFRGATPSQANGTTTLRVAIVTSVHRDFDVRIWRYAKLTQSFAETHLVCPWKRPNGELLEGIRLHTFEPPKSMLSRHRSAYGVIRRLLPLLSRVDIVHFHDFDLLPIMMVLSTFKHVVYDVHENYADEMLVRHWVPDRLRRTLYNSVIAAHWAASRTIGNIVCVVPDQEEQFRGAKRILLVRNFASEERAKESVDDYSSREPAIISTASHYPTNGTWVLLEIAERLLERAPRMTVLMSDRFVNESFRKEVLKSIERRNISNVRILANVTPTQIMDHLNAATIGVSTALNVPKNFKALPTKLFEYMAAGIPVVASAHPHTAAVIQDAGCGFCCDPDRPESFVEAIIQLTENPSAARVMGLAGRTAFLDRYTWESQGGALASFYGGIVSSQRRGQLGHPISLHSETDSR